MSLIEHLQSGATTVCRCWDVTRRDGLRLGFTDHDNDLVMDGLTYRAGTGLSARALTQTTGLSVDNTEAMGALTADAITEDDIAAGRYDGAEVTALLVNWQDTTEHLIRFRGTIGELRRGGGAFHAELRGLTERLNTPVGRVYQKPCGAVLGDSACGVDLTDPALSVETEVTEAGDTLSFAGLVSYQAGWFDRGQLVVLTGAMAGGSRLIKADKLDGETRVITLWDPLELTPGDSVHLVAGCDKRAETCRAKFGNFLNFRGFPDIPGEDWLIRTPRPAGSA